MYPVIPGVGGVALGTPLFPRSVVHMGNGSTLEILALGNGIYVQSAALNGKPYTSTWLPLEALSSGANRLEFTLGAQPAKNRGTNSADAPPSFDDPQKR
jgi:putative alpha-1,2-mannosidase